MRSEHGACFVIELPGHEARCVLDDRHFRVEPPHRARCFEPEQSAADHDGASTAHATRKELLCVAQLAERVNAFEIDAGNVRNDRCRSRRDHELRIRLDSTVRIDDAARSSIDGLHGAAEATLDVRRSRQRRIRIPSVPTDFTGEQRAQANTVVRLIGFGAVQHDGYIAAAPMQLAGDAYAHGSATDDDDRTFCERGRGGSFERGNHVSNEPRNQKKRRPEMSAANALAWGRRRPGAIGGSTCLESSNLRASEAVSDVDLAYPLENQRICARAAHWRLVRTMGNARSRRRATHKQSASRSRKRIGMKRSTCRSV